MNWENSIIGWENHSSEDGRPLLEARGGDWWFLWKAYDNSGVWHTRGAWVGRKKSRDAVYRQLEEGQRQRRRRGFDVRPTVAQGTRQTPMTCPICHSSADQLWHGVPICTPCREGQRVVDRRLNWILVGCAAVIIACMIRIAL